MKNNFNISKLNNPRRFNLIPPEYIWAKLDIDECNILVDLGAGTGLFSEAFTALAECQVTYAYDISPDMIDWMKENLSNSTKKIIPVLMKPGKIPLDDNSADLVLMINLFHEVKNPVYAINEVYRVLKKDGKICIIDWKKMDSERGPSFEKRVGEDKIIESVNKCGFSSVNCDDGLQEHSFVWGTK